MSDVKRINIAEFRELGYLQEVNRLFFHPLGLALEVVIHDCPNCQDGAIHGGTSDNPTHDPCPTCGGEGKLVRLGGVWDSREDPEGFFFAEELDEEKIAFVKAEFGKRAGAREKMLAPGRIVQGAHDSIPPFTGVAGGRDVTDEVLNRKPTRACDSCGRKTWADGTEELIGTKCLFPQPDGSKCQGVFRAIGEGSE